MNKKIINDIIVPQRSIRRIPIPTEKRQKNEPRADQTEINQTDIVSPRSKRSTSWRRKSLSPRLVIWLLAIICLLALFFGVSILFSSAKVIVTPRTEKITFNDDIYSAKLDSTNMSDMSFETLTIKQNLGERVEATENMEVSQKASGKIVIYNSYNTVSQRLISNTRFEANNGKIYRITQSVIVPGLKKNDGKVVPGSVEVTVYADEPGEDYNLKLADLVGDFKIPGFKGDPRYQGFYARLKTDIIGGFVGTRRIVSNELRNKASDLIKVELKEQLVKELYTVKPENYSVFGDNYTIEYADLPDSTVDDDEVQINIEGRLTAVVFNNPRLADYLAVKKIKDFDKLPVEIIPADNFKISFLNNNGNFDFPKGKVLDAKLSGEAIIKWTYDAENFKKDLAGKKESDIRNLLNRYKNSITEIQIIFKPVWTRYVPDDLEKIKVEEVL